MTYPASIPVVLYDGYCPLCSASVRFVIKYDRRKVFRFAALQSETGRQLLREVFTEKQIPDSIVYIDKGKAYTRSDALLGILRRLGSPWKFLWFLRYIPPFIRDGLYNIVAKLRYRLFGRRDSCDILPREWQYTL